LKAISCLNFYDIDFTKDLTSKLANNYRELYPFISGVFELTEDDMEWINSYIAGPEKDSLLTGAESNTSQKVPGIFYLQVKRWGNIPDNISIEIYNETTGSYDLFKYIKNRAEFLDRFYNEIYPAILFFEQEEMIFEPATTEELLSSDKRFDSLRKLFYLGGLKDMNELKVADDNELHTIIEDSNEKLNEIFKEHYKQDGSIQLAISKQGEKYNLIIKDSSKKASTINERAPGFRYYFFFLVNKLYSNLAYEKHIIYLLDEPGLNLHPKGARDLLNTFNELTVSNQLVYTTHNPFLTLRNTPASLIYVKRSGKKGSKVLTKPWKSNYQVMRRELGILLNDSFLLGDINLVVEGIVEKYILHELFQNDNTGELEWLNIFDAESASKIPQIVNYLGVNCLDLAGIIVVDGDGPGNDVARNKSVLKNIQTGKWHLLSIGAILERNSAVTFEDLFPSEIYIAAYNQYCKKFSESLELKAFQPLEDAGDNISILEIVKNHFEKQGKEENSKVTFEGNVVKLDIARMALEAISRMNSDERKVAMANFDKLTQTIKDKSKQIITHVGN
ncbi:MAG TPA: AAA family ATPase, partial [Chitinophagales bacterium]|nr:AAA family ATPase [Chitinophagales bacterium]